MRLQLEFYMEALPKSYRLGILSIIKEMLKIGSETYYLKLFRDNKREFKPFSHAAYIRNLSLGKDRITGDKLRVTVSSASHEFIMHLSNGSERNKIYNYRGYKLKLKKKRLLPPPPKITSIVTFKTLSPILIEDKYQNPILANDPRFETELNYYAELLLKELYGRKLRVPLTVLGTSMKKMVLQENLHQSQESPVFLTTNQGLLKLKGHPEDLQILYEMGVGRRRSLGLGLLDIEEVISE